MQIRIPELQPRLHHKITMKLVSRHIPKEFEDEQVSLLPEDPEDMVSRSTLALLPLAVRPEGIATFASTAANSIILFAVACI